MDDCLAMLNNRSITNYCIQIINEKAQLLNEEHIEYISHLATIAHCLILYDQYESILRSK